MLQARACKLQTHKVSMQVVSIYLKYVHKWQMYFYMKCFVCTYVYMQVCS